MEMRKNTYLLELISNIKQQTIPSSWYLATKRIKKDEMHLDEMLKVSKPPIIYGVNTLVGHLDHVNLTDKETNQFQQYLVHNHMLGDEENYLNFEVDCISYIKMHDLSLGGSGITLDLYNHLLALMEKGLFNIDNIPKNASYSSGDVIPGAHWANGVSDLLHENFSYQLQRKEGLSLINGSFVHVGISVAKVFVIQPLWALYNHNSLYYIDILKSKQSNFSEQLITNKHDSMANPLNWARTKAKSEGEQKIQDPISIRSYPQVSSAFFNSIIAFTNAIEEQLSRRSDNPLVVHEEKETLSQASFIAPMISLATGQLIESMLLVMWQIERRLHFLLSGSVENIPQNGSTNSDPLGLIQVPKLVSAILEETRLKAGRRTFASGGSTSYGIEDIWTNGLTTLDTLQLVSNNLNRMLAIELSVILNVKKEFLKSEDDLLHFAKYNKNDNFRNQYKKIAIDNKHLKLPISYNLKPFDQI